MHPAIQRPGKPDKLSEGEHNQTSYPRIQWENTLDKRGATEPQEQMSLEESNPERSLSVEATTTEGNTGSRARARMYDYPCCRKARNQA